MSNRNASNGERHPRDESPPADRFGQVPLAMKGVGSQPWIKMRTNLWDDPRVSELCDTLKTTEATVIGGLFRLWSIGDSHSTNGELRGLTAESLDRKAGITGFAVAVERVGWLVIGERMLTITEFDIHNGHSAKSRALATLRKRSERARTVSGNNGHAEPVTQPSRRQRDKNVTRTEKSRADKKQPPPPSPLAPPAAGASELGAVEVLLSEAGTTTAGTTALQSVKRGYTRHHVRELLDYLRSHGELFADWKAALVFRLKNSPPATPVDQGWPTSKTKSRTTDDTRRADQFSRDFRQLGTNDRRALCERSGLAESQFDLCLDDPKLLRKLMAQWDREHPSRGQGDKPP